MTLWLCERCPLRYTTVQDRCACGGRLVGVDELLAMWRAAIPVVCQIRDERRRIGHMVELLNVIEQTWGDIICGPEPEEGGRG